jgi:hypothetical protein
MSVHAECAVYRAQAAGAIDDYDVMRKEWSAMQSVIRNLNPRNYTNDENMTRVMLEQQ